MKQHGGDPLKTTGTARGIVRTHRRAEADPSSERISHPLPSGPRPLSSRRIRPLHGPERKRFVLAADAPERTEERVYGRPGERLWLTAYKRLPRTLPSEGANRVIVAAQLPQCGCHRQV